MADVIAGRFVLCDPIARGGSGTVWRAYDRRREQLCAAKVLRQRDAGDLLRFVREQSVRIAGPHVLSPYSWAAEDEHVVIASELAEAGSLGHLLARVGPFAPSTAAVVLDQLLEALEHVHAAGMVHRDVKTANILVHATGTGPVNAQLSDFGLTIGDADARLTEVGWVIGTPNYLAPELLGGNPSPEPRHDLYAAGRVAAALLNGVEPEKLTMTVVAPGTGPLGDVVRALGAFDPADRPASAAEARHALRPLLGDPTPRRADGTPFEIGSQLPPLPDDLARELGLLPAAAEPWTPPWGTAPTAVTPATAAGPRQNEDPKSRNGPTHTAYLTPPTRPNERAPEMEGGTRHAPTPPSPFLAPSPPGPRSRRSRLLLAAAALVCAAAVAVPVTLALTDDSGSGSATGPVAPPTGTLGGSPAPVVHAVGSACDWQQEGDLAVDGSGHAVVCAAGRGVYLWATR